MRVLKLKVEGPMTFLRCLAFIQKLIESVAQLEQHHGYYRSENQSRESLGGRRSRAIYDIVVFWQTFVNDPISAAPLLVDEGAKSKDLQQGADQSSLFERLRLGGNCDQDSSRADRSNHLSSAV